MVTRLVPVVLLLWLGISPAIAQSFTLVRAGQQAVIVLPESEPQSVRLAVQDLVNDVQKITGKTLAIVTQPSTKSAAVIIRTDAKQFAPSAWEAYRVNTQSNNLTITGSDERGTMFAIYHFIEQYLGVDPTYRWTDREPTKQATLQWPTVSIRQDNPTFRFRGWFINDEDLLTEWYESAGKRKIDYPFYSQVAAPEVLRHVCETMLRLRCNLLIPASFIDIRNPAERALVDEAAKRGLFVSMHHVEPMGVSAFTFFNYWRAKKGLSQDGKASADIPRFSYFSSRPELEEVWRVYAREWAKYPNVIWQIGLRGIADRPMWLADPSIPQSDADRGRLISEAMHTQMAMIREVSGQKSPLVTTTLWAEGSVLNAKGLLNVPKGITQVFADNSPGWRWQKDFHETPRQPDYTYGVYYHHQLWGSGPHLAQGVPPRQTYDVLGQAVAKGDTQYLIANVANVREFVLGVAATARMSYDYAHFKPDTFLTDWCRGYYGSASGEIEKAYRAYFQSFALHNERRVPYLLDGQIKAAGLGLLRQLNQQITQPTAYAESQKQASKISGDAQWVNTSLGDMHPHEPDTARFAAQIRQQITGFADVVRQVTSLSKNLTESERRFLSTNLEAPARLMQTLSAWLNEIRLAKAAEDRADVVATQRHLTEALRLIQSTVTVRQLASVGPTWQHWYRGEKKVNLALMIEQTRQTTERATQRPSSPTTTSK